MLSTLAIRRVGAILQCKPGYAAVRLRSNGQSGAQSKGNIKTWILNNLQGASINDVSNAFVRARKERVSFSNTDIASVIKMMEMRSGDIQSYHVANIINGLRLSQATQDGHVINLLRFMDDKMKSSLMPPRAIGTLMQGLSGIKLRHAVLTSLLSSVAQHIRTTSRPFPSVALCEIVSGVQHMNQNCPGVRSILKLLPSRIHNALTPFTPQSISNMLYSLNKYNSYDRDVRTILSALEPQIHICDVRFKMRDIACCIYGLRNMSDEYFEVRKILQSLVEKVNAVTSEPSGSFVVSAIAGLRSMNGHPESIAMLEALTVKLQMCKEMLNAQHITMLLTGVKGFGADNAVVRNAISVITQKIRECSLPFQAPEISGSYFALQHMSSEYHEVVDLLNALNEKLKQYDGPFDAQTVANTLFGFQNISNNHQAVLEALRLLAPKLLECGDGLEIRHVSAAFYGLKSMSNCHEVDHVLLSLQHKLVISALPAFDSLAVGSIYGGFKNMKCRRIVREVLARITEKIQSGLPKRVEGRHISTAFVGLRNMYKYHHEVICAYRLLNDLLHVAESVDVVDVCRIVSSLQYATDNTDCVQSTIELITTKIVGMRDPIMPAFEFSCCISGLQCHRGTTVTNHFLRVLFQISPLDDITFANVAKILRGLQRMDPTTAVIVCIMERIAQRIDKIELPNQYNSLGYTLVSLIENSHTSPAAIALHKKIVDHVKHREYENKDILNALLYIDLATPHPRRDEVFSCIASLALALDMNQLPSHVVAKLCYVYSASHSSASSEIIAQCLSLCDQFTPQDIGYVLLSANEVSVSQRDILITAMMRRLETYNGNFSSRSIALLLRALILLPANPDSRHMLQIITHNIPSTLMDYNDVIQSIHALLTGSNDITTSNQLISALADKVEKTANRYWVTAYESVTQDVIALCDKETSCDSVHQRISQALKFCGNLKD